MSAAAAADPLSVSPSSREKKIRFYRGNNEMADTEQDTHNQIYIKTITQNCRLLRLAHNGAC